MVKKEKALPFLFTVTVLGTVIWWTQRRPETRNVKPEPDEAIWAMVKACRDGDIGRYLDCFAGELRKRLEKTVQEKGEQRFRDYLRQLISSVKGIAVLPPQRDEQGNWRVPTEFVFADRTESQTYRVRQVDGQWQIVSVETARRVPVLIPYGTLTKGL